MDNYITHFTFGTELFIHLKLKIFDNIIILQNVFQRKWFFILDKTKDVVQIKKGKLDQGCCWLQALIRKFILVNWIIDLIMIVKNRDFNSVFFSQSFWNIFKIEFWNFKYCFIWMRMLTVIKNDKYHLSLFHVKQIFKNFCEHLKLSAILKHNWKRAKRAIVIFKSLCEGNLLLLFSTHF